MDAAHSYKLKAISTTIRSGVVLGDGVGPSISFSAPPEFGGAGGLWTPEHFLVMAVASCFVSTFSAIADISHLEFLSLDLEAEGTLEKLDHGWRFAEIILRPTIRIPAEKGRERALRLLEKAERGCLVARSLNCAVTLHPEIKIEEEIVAHAMI